MATRDPNSDLRPRVGSASPILGWLVSTMFTVVTVTGAAVAITALVMFFPGTNAIDPVAAAGNPDGLSTTEAPAASTTTSEVSTSATSGGTEATTTTQDVPTTTQDVPTTTTSAAPGGTSPPLFAAPLVPYRVERGDTVDSIAAAVGIEPVELLTINQLPVGAELGIGTVLLVPGVDEEQLLVPAVLAENPDRARLIEVFQRWADQYGVPQELLMAVGWHASQWDNTIVGSEGELGVMQLDGDVASWIAENLVGIPLDAAVESENIQLAAAYLGWLLSETEGDTSASLAAFYDGLTSQRNIPWREDTVEYISAVLGLRPVFDPRAAINVSS